MNENRHSLDNFDASIQNTVHRWSLHLWNVFKRSSMGLPANVASRKLSKNIVGPYANCMDKTLRSGVYLYWRPIRVPSLYNVGAFWCTQDYRTFFELYIINFYRHRLSRESLDQKRISFTLSVG